MKTASPKDHSRAGSTRSQPFLKKGTEGSFFAPQGKKQSFFSPTGIQRKELTVSRAGNLIQRDPKPWQEVEGDFRRGRQRVHVFQHGFSRGTSLAAALGWMFSHSTARLTDFEFQDPALTTRAETNQGHAEIMGRPTFYQEVALVWHLSRRRFTAYTTQSSTSGTITPAGRNVIFVAHTHPTPRQLQASGGVQWRTSFPSPEDVGNFKNGQRHSIICHLDPADNRTVSAFVYNNAGAVVSRFSGGSPFAQAASRFIELERQGRTAGRRVGVYRR